MSPGLKTSCRQTNESPLRGSCSLTIQLTRQNILTEVLQYYYEKLACEQAFRRPGGAAYIRGDRTKSQKNAYCNLRASRFAFLASDQQNYNLLILKFPLFSNKSSFSVRLLLADLLYNMLRIGSKILLDFFAFDGQSKNAWFFRSQRNQPVLKIL